MEKLFRPATSLIIFLLAFAWNASAQTRQMQTGDEVKKINNFEVLLEKLRLKYSIPSISVGIARGKELIWKKGFGYADIEHKIVPDENTIYHLASITKTFGSIILMQLVEQGKINLDDPVTKYNIHLGARWNDDPRIQVRHLLTHTAQGNSFNAFKPGYSFRYNGDFYSQLGKVIGKLQEAPLRN